MTTASVPSGLGATLGFGDESTVGTTVTPTRWLYFKKEGLALKKTVVASEALGMGRVQQSARRVVTGLSVDGSIDIELQDRGLGLLLKHMLGSTPAVTTFTGGATQVHAFGTNFGMGLTTQVGRPDVTNTMRAFTYGGCKVVDWSIGAATGQIGQLSLNIDGITSSDSTSYTAASFVKSNPLHFAQGALKVGGTVTTSAGVASASGATTISSGGTYAGAVKSVTIKGTNPVNADRRTLGSVNKLEQAPNGFVAITAEAEIEFADVATFYDVFATVTPETPLALELDFNGNAIGSSGHNAALNLLIPSVFIDEDPVSVEGPELLTQKLTFTGLYDATNTPIQATYVSADTTI